MEVDATQPLRLDRFLEVMQTASNAKIARFYNISRKARLQDF